jgi:hypothetical protein
MEGLPFLAGGGVNLTGLQIVDITRIFSYFFWHGFPTSASCNQNPSSSEDNFTIVTRSRASEIDWTACILQTQSL